MFFYAVMPANVQLSCSAQLLTLFKNRFHTRWHHSLNLLIIFLLFFYSEGQTRKNSVTLTLLHFHSMKYSNTFTNQNESFEIYFFRTCWHQCMCFLILELFSYHFHVDFSSLNFIWPSKKDIRVWIVYLSAFLY